MNKEHSRAMRGGDKRGGGGTKMDRPKEEKKVGPF